MRFDMDECVLMGLLTAARRGSRAGGKIGRLLAVARTRNTLMVSLLSRRYAASGERRVCNVRFAKMSGGAAVPLMTSSHCLDHGVHHAHHARCVCPYLSGVLLSLPGGHRPRPASHRAMPRAMSA